MRIKTHKSNHEVEILAELNKERKALQSTCDVTLTAGSRNFPAHRCILVAFSIFFKKLFTCEMKEKHENKANVKSINEETMESVLDFIYSSHVKFTSENVYDLLEAANFLGISSLKGYCAEFLLEEIDSDNCLSMRSYAKLYNVDKLHQKVDETIKENFEAVIQTKEFKELEVDDVSKLMQMKEKQVSSEESVFHALIGWINHNLSTRQLELNKLFKLIDIDELSFDFVHNVVAKENLIRNSKECLYLMMLSLSSPGRAVGGSLRNVGMEDGRLPDSSITASSYTNSSYAPQYGRLNNQPNNSGGRYYRRGRSHRGCWSPCDDWVEEYIQIQLDRPTRVVGVVTQGSPTGNYYTTSFTIAYSNATDNMQTIAQDGSDKVFQGNVDANTPVTNMFPEPVTARYFRLIIQSCDNFPAIRMELLTR